MNSNLVGLLQIYWVALGVLHGEWTKGIVEPDWRFHDPIWCEELRGSGAMSPIPNSGAASSDKLTRNGACR